MKALMYTALKTLEMRDLPAPTPAAGEVVVKVGATGICGSDIHGFLGHQLRRQPGLVLGHETVGVVAQTGAGVSESLEGTRVSVNPLITCGVCDACRSGRQNCCQTWRLLGLDKTQGAFAEYVNVPARNCHPLADNVTDAAAVMVEPLANAFHLRANVPAHSPVLPTAVIFGAGTLGACILSVCLASGVRILLVSEPNPLRAEVARKLGVAHVVDPRDRDIVAEVRDLTGGCGVDFALDAVGLQATRQAAAAVVTKGGAAMLLGMDEAQSSFDFSDLVRREVRLQCSFAYSDRDYASALAFVSGGGVDYLPWTDQLPLESGQQAFDRLVADPKDRLKIVLTP